MSKFNLIKSLIITITILLVNNLTAVAQIKNPENIKKVVRAHLAFRFDTLKAIDKSKFVIFAGARKIDNDSIWFEVCVIPTGYLKDLVYDKVYTFEGFPLLFFDSLDQNTELKKIFKETSSGASVPLTNSQRLP